MLDTSATQIPKCQYHLVLSRHAIISRAIIIAQVALVTAVMADVLLQPNGQIGQSKGGHSSMDLAVTALVSYHREEVEEEGDQHGQREEGTKEVK